MTEIIYRITFRILLFTVLVVLLHATWKWGAPWFMGSATLQIVLATQQSCKETPGCLRVRDLRPRWIADTNFYCPAYLLVVSKKIPKKSEDDLVNAVWKHSADNPGLLYRPWVRKPCVWMNHE